MKHAIAESGILAKAHENLVTSAAHQVKVHDASGSLHSVLPRHAILPLSCDEVSLVRRRSFPECTAWPQTFADAFRPGRKVTTVRPDRFQHCLGCHPSHSVIRAAR